MGNEIDEKYLEIMRCIFPSWVEKIEEEISLPVNNSPSQQLETANRERHLPSSTSSNNESHQSIVCNQNLVQSESFDRTTFEGNFDVNVMSQDDVANRDELMSKINQIHEKIDNLQMKLDLFAKQSLYALNNYDTTPSAIAPNVISREVVMSKITEIQQEINKLRKEINLIGYRANMLDTQSSRFFHDDF